MTTRIRVTIDALVLPPGRPSAYGDQLRLALASQLDRGGLPRHLVPHVSQRIADAVRTKVRP
jgi:hypothetical protein